MYFLLAQTDAGAAADAANEGFGQAIGQFLEANRFTLNNVLVLAIVALLIFVLVAAWRNKYWQGVIRRIFRVKRASISFAVLAIFLFIGVLDSISWRDYRTGEDGAVMTNPDGEPMLAPEGRTLLDRLDSATLELSSKPERTYSAPLADKQFSRETVVLESGETARIKPELTFPGAHPLGTDQIGQDVLFKALKGVRTALIIGGFTTVLAIPFALFFGMMAGYYGKWADDIIMYVYTVLASIPRVLLIIAFVVAFGQGLFQLCVIMGITTWVYLGRLIRGETLKVREMDYVQAAKAAGASGLRIQMRHILPNVFHLVIIRAVLMFSGLVLAEAVLTYLNVGVGSDVGSWGRMIYEGQLELSREPIIWWNLSAAFVFMFTLLLAANVFGDVVRDALDPRLRDVK